MHALARIDHDHTFRMIDDPRVSGEPFGPVRVSENGEPSSQPAPTALDLRGLDADGASLDGV